MTKARYGTLEMELTENFKLALHLLMGEYVNMMQAQDAEYADLD